MREERTITAGEYDSYHIVARIEGPSEPSVDSLWADFDTIYHVVWKDGKGDKPRFTAITARIDYENKAEEKLRSEGFTGWSIAELFVDWLVKTKQFTLLEVNEFHISR